MLNFAKSVPKVFDWELFDWDDSEDESVRMRTGKQLLMRYYVSSFDQFKYMRHDYEEELSFVGYPSATGAGSYFNINGGLSITAACQNPEAAWSFVRYLLTEEHQEDFWGFPSNRHVFETRKEASMKEEETADMPVAEAAAVGARVEAAVAVDGVMPEEDRVKPLTEADCQRIMDLYESCSTIYGTNEEVMNIINEEVEPFFDGQKTAEETAKLIQNRVSLYVAEQG